MDIQRALRDFITFHEVNNDSPETIENYRSVLARFIEWLFAEEVTDTEQLTVAHLREWVSYLQKTPTKWRGKLSDSSVRMYASYTQIFCRWLEHEEIIMKPVTTRFKLPRVEKKLIPTFTPDEVERLLMACEEGDRRKPRLRKALSYRNRAIVTVLIDTGIRLSELVGLRLCDIDRDLSVLNVRRKGNKWQQVPVSRDGFKPLHEYLTKHRPFLAASGGRIVARKEDAVFLADDGEPLTNAGVSKLFTRLRERTGIDGKRVSPHNCRRYMATTQLWMGRSPLDVQRQMGHTTLAMTNHYASLTTEHLRKSHERFSPLHAKRGMDTEGSGNGYWDE